MRGLLNMISIDDESFINEYKAPAQMWIEIKRAILQSLWNYYNWLFALFILLVFCRFWELKLCTGTLLCAR
jgi:hypothetical protein